MIQFTDEDRAARRIANIVYEIQVLNDRFGECRALRSMSKEQLVSFQEQAVVIYARALSLFAFARGEEEPIDKGLTWEHIFNAIDITAMTRAPLARRLKELQAKNERVGTLSAPFA